MVIMTIVMMEKKFKFINNERSDAYDCIQSLLFYIVILINMKKENNYEKIYFDTNYQ
jgi:hypothetical protein